MSGYDTDGGDGVYGMMGVSDNITYIFQRLYQKKNTLLSTIPKFTLKEKITTSFCKDFMKIKHHSIRNTILPSSFRDLSLKSLSANFEKSSQIPNDIKFFGTEIVDGYDFDLYPNQS